MKRRCSNSNSILSADLSSSGRENHASNISGNSNSLKANADPRVSSGRRDSPGIRDHDRRDSSDIRINAVMTSASSPRRLRNRAVNPISQSSPGANKIRNNSR